MKKFNVLAIFFLSFVMIGSLQAQDDVMDTESKAYVRFNVGYGFGNGGSQPAGSNITTSIGSDIFNAGEANQVQKNIYGSLGKGLQVNLAAGYKFNKYFSGEFGFVYLKGANQDLESITDSDNNFDRSESYTTQFQVRPGLVFEADNNSKIVPYARVALILPVAGASYGERESNNPAGLSSLVPSFYPNAESFQAESVAKGMPTLGFEGTLGVKYKVNDKLNIHAELFHNALRVKRKTYEVSKAVLINADGSESDIRSVLALGGVYAHIEYKDEINAEELLAHQTAAAAAYAENPADISNLPQDVQNLINNVSAFQTYYGTEDYPAWALREDFNFNSLGLSIGVSFNF